MQENDDVHEAFDRMAGNLLATAMDYLANAPTESKGRVFMAALANLPPSWRLHANVKLSDLVQHWEAALYAQGVAEEEKLK